MTRSELLVTEDFLVNFMNNKIESHLLILI